MRKKLFSYITTSAVLFLFYGVTLGQGYTKNRFGFSAHYNLGFQGKEVTLNTENIEKSQFHGVSIKFNHEYFAKEFISLQTAIGYRYGYFEGVLRSGRYFGSTHKLVLSEKVRYSFKNEFSILLGASMVNNLDFEEFGLKRSDLFRFDLELGVAYTIDKNWEISLDYSIALNANEDVYLLTNPNQRVLAGIQFYLK